MNEYANGKAYAPWVTLCFYNDIIVVLKSSLFFSEKVT